MNLYEFAALSRVLYEERLRDAERRTQRSAMGTQIHLPMQRLGNLIARHITRHKTIEDRPTHLKLLDERR